MAGMREMKKPEKKSRGPVIAGTAAALALGGYLGLCAWVGEDRILPNVSVAGYDLSGLTAAEATEQLRTGLEGQSGELDVQLNYGSWSGRVEDCILVPDDELSAQEALAVGHDSFITRGFSYLSHQLGQGSRVLLRAEMGEDTLRKLEQQLDEAERAEGGDMVGSVYAVEGAELVLTKGVTGVSIDREEAVRLVREALGRAIEERTDTDSIQVEPVTLTAQTQSPEAFDFHAIWEELSVEPKDAAIDPETHKITEHVVGVDFDWQAAQQAYEQAEEGETVRIPLTLTQPKETAQSLQAKLFRDVLGQAHSRVGGSSNRKTNVKLSAQACNGVILMPGEVFSYNNTTGSRSADKGYLAAPVYSGGASVDEVGGGICQTSSTIYYAVLHTTLDVVERRSHMYAVGYVPDGMDATVYYGATDFRFKNSTNYPIKIVTESYDKDGSRFLAVKILGTNEDGRYAKPERSRFDYVEPTVKYVPRDDIPRGTYEVDKKQNPYRGRTAQTVRYIYEKDGSLAEKQDMGVSKYKMRPETRYYNPLDGDPASWPDGVPPKPQPVKPEQPEVKPETPVVPPEQPETPVVPPEQPEVPVAPPEIPEPPVQPEVTPEHPSDIPHKNDLLKPGELPEGM